MAQLKNPRHEAFAREYVRDGNATAAYCRAGYSENGAHKLASRLMANEGIRDRIAELQAEIAEATKLDVEKVVQRLTDIATADPNELVSIRTTACRHCHGIDHAYQWRTEHELQRAITAWGSLPQAKRDITPMPDPAGGFGYSRKLAPNPDCPECDGDGIEDIKLKDTTRLSPAALALYAGAKRTKEGLEVKMADQSAALDAVAKHLGVFERHNKQLNQSAGLAELLKGMIHKGGSRAPLNAGKGEE